MLTVKAVRGMHSSEPLRFDDVSRRTGFPRELAWYNQAKHGLEPRKELQFKTEEDYKVYARAASESVEIGKGTLSALAQQSEALDRASAVVAATHYEVDRSARVLRGMTWWGAVQNWFSSEPVAPRPHKAVCAQQERSEEPVAIQPHGIAQVDARYSSTTCAGSFTARQQSDRDELFLSRRTPDDCMRTRSDTAPRASLPEVQRVQDEHLSRLSGLLDEQRKIGSTIHGALQNQNMQVEDLGMRIEDLHDRTRSVVRKAARLSQSSWGGKPKFVANVALREVTSGLFVSVRGDELRVLEPVLCHSCKLAVYMVQQNVSGFQSLLNRQWVGQTLLGDLRVRGDHLGRNESFEVEWSQDPQVGGFLMSYSANWGNGGYVLIGKEGKLTIGGYSSKEKHSAARFQLVDCDDYTDGSLVSDVLVWQPSKAKGT